MKTKCFYGMLLSAAVLLTACSDDMLDGRRGEVPITLTTTVLESHGSMATRAGVDVQSTQLPSGATFMAKFTGVDVNVSSATYTADGQGGATTTTQPYIISSDNSTTVHAYCPSKPLGTFSVQADQSNDADYRASDLMYATATIGYSSPVGELTFTHKMAKIIVNATVGEGIGSITGVYINNVYRTVNITDATACTLGTTLTNKGNIPMWTGTQTSGTLSCAALLPPQTVTSSDFLKITTNQGNVIYNLDSKTFASGQAYTINATINDAAVGSTIDITNWEDNGSVTVNPNKTTEQCIFVPLGALPGKFTINESGAQVYFSQGNLRATYDGSNWTWSFAENQWDYIGSTSGNKNLIDGSSFINGSTVDLFCWVGASSTWTGVAQYGIISSDKNYLNATDGYGNVADEDLKSDWGTLPIVNGGNTANSGWRTLTSDEWTYVLNTRSTISGMRYTRAQVNGKNGLILLPDDWSSFYYTLKPFESTMDWTDNSISLSDWNSSLAPHGCVFLPTAGCRLSDVISGPTGHSGTYCSSSPFTGNVEESNFMVFNGSNYGDARTLRTERNHGGAVRLVYDYPYSDCRRMSNAQPSDVGKIICSKGHIHSTVNEATAAGCTASGIIAYVGDAGTADKSTNSGSYIGLALALYDYGGSLTTNGSTCKWYTANSGTCITSGQSSTVGTAIGTTGDFGKGIDNTNRLATAACTSGHVHAAAQNAKNFSDARPAGASRWFLPTMYQWNLMVKAMCGQSTNLTTSANSNYKYDKFNAKITDAGGRGVSSGYYWSSVEYSTSSAWNMDFTNGKAYNLNKSNTYYVRAVFAF